MIKRNILLTPGPATTTDSVKYAQVVPDICPREKKFGNLMESICRDLTKIVSGGDNYTCVLFGGSGTAVMEAVISSVVSPRKKILVIRNGVYGDRMVDIARTHNIDCLSFTCDKIPNTKDIEVMLKKLPKISCIAMVHHETTTGILNPIKEIGELAKKYKKTFIVDAVSSFAGIPFTVKSCNVDFMFSTSNKCLQGMPGVGFAICNKKGLEKIKDYPKRSFYLDLYDQYKYFEKYNQIRFTPPVQTMYALREAINEYYSEGGRNRHKRYCDNWKVLSVGLKGIGFKLLLKDGIQSKLITTIIEPEDKNYDFNKMHDLLLEKGFTIYPGKLSNKKTFRIGNIGEIYPHDIERFINALIDILNKMGVEF